MSGWRLVMDRSILFALCSLLFAGVNDLVFKKQATSGYGRGQYMSIAGVVWAAFFVGWGLIHGRTDVAWQAIAWGAAAGTLSVSANYLLIASLRQLDASVGATIYRLNMVAAALIAVVFLGEPLGAVKSLGLTAGAASVVMFSLGNGKKSLRSVLTGAMMMVVTASLLRALMGITYKLATSDFAELQAAGHGSQDEWFLAVQGGMWMVVGFLCSARFEGRPRLTAGNVVYGTLSGLLICGIVLFFAWALAAGQASVVIPIAQMSFLVTAVLSLPVTREKLSGAKAAGLGLAVAAILLLSRT